MAIRTGGCRCGAIRFRAHGPPLWVVTCHCASCRRATGAPMATWAGFPEDRVAFAGAAPADHASSPGVRRTFCPTCGTPLAYRGGRWPGEVHLLVATFDAPEDLPPRAHVNVGEKLPWVHLSDGLRRFRTTGGDGPPEDPAAAP